MAEAAQILFCDQVYIDPISGKVTLLGVFTTLRATKFPSPYRDFVVFAMLQGEPGESGQLSLTCVDATSEEVLFQEETNQIFGAERIHMPLILRVGEFRFPREGWYRFRLTFAEEQIAENVLHIHEASK